MKVVIQLKDSPERQSHEAVKLSSPPQQHNSQPRNQLLDHRRHRYHRNLCYRLQATSPSSLFEIFLGDVRVMSFVARPISSMPAQILHSSLTVKPVCLTLTAHAVILHDPPVCIFNVVRDELRIATWFFFSISIPTSSQIFYAFFDAPVVVRIQLAKFSPAAQKSSIG